MVKNRRTLGKGRKDQLFLHQSHALDHYRKPGACDGYIYNPPRRTALLCPICAHDKPFDEFSEEHAPPTGGQSALGDATTIVLTCADCNTTAGHTFESDAADRAGLPTADDLPAELTCVVHGKRRLWQTTSGLHVVVNEEPVVVTDLKAAFLLAFAALGYTWALARDLLPIRTAVQNETPADSRHSWSGVVQFADKPPVEGNVVHEIGGPDPSVIVRSADGNSVVLPVPGFPTVPVTFSSIRVRSYPWADTLRQGHQVEREHSAGQLFHADFCHTHNWT